MKIRIRCLIPLSALLCCSSLPSGQRQFGTGNDAGGVFVRARADGISGPAAASARGPAKGRIFALLGHELVEVRAINDRLVEQRRVNFSPYVGQ